MLAKGLPKGGRRWQDCLRLSELRVSPSHATWPSLPSPSSLSLISPLSFLLTKKPKLCLFQHEHWTFSTNVQIENYLSRIILPLQFWMLHLLSLNLIQSPMLTGWLQSYTDGSFYPPETGQANDGTGRACDVGWKEWAGLLCSLSSSNFLSGFGEPYDCILYDSASHQPQWSLWGLAIMSGSVSWHQSGHTGLRVNLFPSYVNTILTCLLVCWSRGFTQQTCYFTIKAVLCFNFSRK